MSAMGDHGVRGGTVSRGGEDHHSMHCRPGRGRCRNGCRISPLGAVPGIGDGLQVTKLVGRGARLLVDAWHFALEPSTWEDLEGLPCDKIAYLQFTDVAEPVSDDLFDETMNRRVLPGDGIADLQRFADILRGNGFDGHVSVEVLSRDLRARSVPDAVAAVFGAAAGYWI
jgi:hypothetical protein